MSEPDLIFPEAWQLDGFTTNVTSRQAGEPDPVVRELLQNGLDAAIREAGRDRAEIHFTIAERTLSQLPGREAYSRAFAAAKQGDEKRATHDVRSAVSRIEAALDRPAMNVLFCRDNGIGLDEDRMAALLSEGQSDKAHEGAGSYGLGHLTAYAASDLRYVFYAGVRELQQELQQIASGHAILASHKQSNTRHSSHGYWRAPTDVFSLEDGDFPHSAPDLMRDEIEKIDESGSVIAILGFNYFHNPRSQAADDICKVAALNFMGAIHDGAMVVHVHDERSNESKTVDTTSLRQFLEPIQNDQRAAVAGWFAGQQGYRALRTLEEGRVLDLLIDRSIRVHFRPLGPNSSERSRVQIFRDGMWITNEAPELRTGAFNGVQPFDAVVSLSDADPEDHTEFYDLVRNSEGPEHRGLRKIREMPTSRQNKLREKLRLLADRLRAEAGSRDLTDGFVPPGFAVFSMDDTREAQKLPRVRHRMMAAEQDDSQPSTDPAGAEADGPQSPEHEGRRRSRRHSRRAPAAGTAVKLRRSLVPIVDPDGCVRRLRALLEIDPGATAGGNLGLRVYVESGSDETCEQPIAPVWQSIRSVNMNDQVIDAEGAAEVLISSATGVIDIELDEPAAASAQFEVDVVRRGRSGAKS